MLWNAGPVKTYRDGTPAGYGEHLEYQENDKTWKQAWREEMRARMAQVLTDGKALSKISEH